MIVLRVSSAHQYDRRLQSIIQHLVVKIPVLNLYSNALVQTIKFNSLSSLSHMTSPAEVTATESSKSSESLLPGRLRIWENFWDTNSVRWHVDKPNPQLVQYANLLPPAHPTTSSDNTPAAVSTLTPPVSRILVPLCGKTLDLVWLAQRGYKVIGIEYVVAGIEQFFSEQPVCGGYEKIQINADISLYKAKDLDITIVQADFYSADLTPQLVGGHVDFIWDRAAFIAVNRTDRVKYLHKALSLLVPTRRITSSGNTPAHLTQPDILLEVVVYPMLSVEGPPNTVTDKQIRRSLLLAIKGELNDREEIEWTNTGKQLKEREGKEKEEWIEKEKVELDATKEGVIDEGEVYIELLEEFQGIRYKERMYAIQRK